MALVRKRTGGLIAHEVQGELLLLNSDSQRIHQLNRTATFIWHRCDSVESAEELAALLAEQFEIDQEVAMKDVHHVLRELRALGLAEEA